MRAVMLTLAAGQSVPWRYHSAITDSFVCLEGPMGVETRAPRATRVLNLGEGCAVPPMTAHRVHGKDDRPGKIMIIQGIGDYGNVGVGGRVTAPECRTLSGYFCSYCRAGGNPWRRRGLDRG